MEQELITRVVDYVTAQRLVEILDLKDYSNFSRYAREGDIRGAKKFGKSWAFPIGYVKEEAIKRNIYYKPSLNKGEIPVKLFDFYTSMTVEKKLGYPSSYLVLMFKDGKIPPEKVIRFGYNWGYEKTYIDEWAKQKKNK